MIMYQPGDSPYALGFVNPVGPLSTSTMTTWVFLPPAAGVQHVKCLRESGNFRIGVLEQWEYYTDHVDDR